MGRDASLREVVDLGTTHRLVTLTGAGGIGKPRLGLEAARQLLPRFDGVGLAEVGPLADLQRVPITVATALGLTPATGPISAEGVGAALGGRHALLVLDNCEHLIEAAARMAEAVLRASPVACVITTSREPLRAAGGDGYRGPPLGGAPGDHGGPGGGLRHRAVKPFAPRAPAAGPRHRARPPPPPP